MSFEMFAERIAAMLNLDEVPTGRDVGLFGDLDLDSIEALLLIIFVEELSGVGIPPEDVPAMYTAGDAFSYYEQLCEMARAD